MDIILEPMSKNGSLDWAAYRGMSYLHIFDTIIGMGGERTMMGQG